jgi:SAM-dependent methyltransferase
VGLDISSEMLTAAYSRAGAIGAQVRWCQASIAALPFGANTFDVVIAVTVFCFSGNPGLALKEAARVLRPGGSLVIGELGKYSAWAASRRVRGWLGSRTWSHARFWRVQELRRAMEAAGFRPDSFKGCVYYPPVALLAAALSPFDPLFSRLRQYGAAFIVAKGTKP